MKKVGIRDGGRDNGWGAMGERIQKVGIVNIRGKNKKTRKEGGRMQEMMVEGGRRGFRGRLILWLLVCLNVEFSPFCLNIMSII